MLVLLEHASAIPSQRPKLMTTPSLISYSVCTTNAMHIIDSVIFFLAFVICLQSL